MVAHRFFTLYTRDLLTDSGCVKIAKKLLPTYQHLVKVTEILDRVLSVVFNQCGLSPDELQRRNEELLREISANEPNDDAI